MVEAVRADAVSSSQNDAGDTLLRFDRPAPIITLIGEASRREGVCVGVGADSGEGNPRYGVEDYAVRALRRARSRSGDMPVVVRGRAAESAAWATGLAQLLFFALARRSEAGWEVSNLVRSGLNQKQAARTLNVTEQAVSQRLRAAGYRETHNVEPLLLCLLDQAAQPPTR
ncbi:MAG: hypothetical protein Q4P36_02420 [Bowdeniella nasicola]|nr:hypothetical protein [Bowdeniella nasicola]